MPRGLNARLCHAFLVSPIVVAKIKKNEQNIFIIA